MIKCKYCAVINNKDYGTCDACGAALDEAYTLDEDDIELDDLIEFYKQGFITKNTFMHRLEIYSSTYPVTLKNVSYDEWKTKVKEAGLTSYLAGIEAVTDKVKAMPDLTLEDNIARATAFIRESVRFRQGR